MSLWEPLPKAVPPRCRDTSLRVKAAAPVGMFEAPSSLLGERRANSYPYAAGLCNLCHQWFKGSEWRRGALSRVVQLSFRMLLPPQQDPHPAHRPQCEPELHLLGQGTWNVAPSPGAKLVGSCRLCVPWPDSLPQREKSLYVEMAPEMKHHRQPNICSKWKTHFFGVAVFSVDTKLNASGFNFSNLKILCRPQAHFCQGKPWDSYLLLFSYSQRKKVAAGVKSFLPTATDPQSHQEDAPVVWLPLLGTLKPWILWI